MARSRKKKQARSASRRADELYQKLKPHIVEMIEKNDPVVAGLDFNRIEANSVAVGDLLAKAAMLEALAAQPPATDAEIALARRETLKRADLHVVKAAILSGDGRWEKRWPPPIPVLDLAPSAIAA